MTALSERGFWDSIYSARDAGGGHSGWLAARAKAAARRALRDDEGGSLTANYADSLLWSVLYPGYLRPRPGAKVLEVGSAPGEHLVELHRRFGVDPYGVDYSPSGVELNRQTFADHGLDPGHVYQSDFMDPAFLERHRAAFDVVISRGFVEHFTDPAAVIARHVDLVAPGGMLFVSVPNLRGINRALAWLTDREVLAMHNLAIMRRRVFEQLFDLAQVEPVLCRYSGTFDLTMQNARPGTPAQRALAVAARIQPALNALFRMAFGRRGLESSWWSPQLIFIGRKRVLA